MSPNTSIQSLHLEVAKDICNLNCLFCCARKREYVPYDFSGLDKIISFCKKNKINNITIQGGEVTAHPKLYTFCKELSDLGCSFNFITNGYALDENWIALLAKSANRVNVSLNTPYPETYLELCQGDWQNVIANLRKLQSARLNSGNLKQELCISMVICKNNVSQLTDFYKLSRSLGLDYINFLPDIDSEYKLDLHNPADLTKLKISYQELLEAIQTETNVNSKTLNALNIVRDFIQTAYKTNTDQENTDAAKPENIETNKFCNAADTSLYIDHELNVYACCGTTEHSYGSLKENELDKIIDSPQRKLLQNKLKNNDYSLCHKYCSQRPR